VAPHSDNFEYETAAKQRNSGGSKSLLHNTTGYFRPADRELRKKLEKRILYVITRRPGYSTVEA
jgi:hypothetical protein